MRKTVGAMAIAAVDDPRYFDVPDFRRHFLSELSPKPVVVTPCHFMPPVDFPNSNKKRYAIEKRTRA